MKRFSDLPAAKRGVWAEKVKIGDILGVEITITGFYIMPSKYGNHEDVMRLEFMRDDTPHICSTSSAMLRRQLEATKDELPYMATIVEKDHWFSLS